MGADKNVDLGGLGMFGGALPEAMQRLFDDPSWEFEHPDLAARLRTRDQHWRAHDVATRRVQVGAAQELTERQQLARMAQQIQERAEAAARARDAATRRERVEQAMSEMEMVASESTSDEEMEVETVNATQENTAGSGIPDGYHTMPDGQLMLDDAHMYGEGYYTV